MDNFWLPVSLAATRVVPIPFPRALTRCADLALWPVEMFTISCSSHFNGWIIWWRLLYYSHPPSSLPVGDLVVLGVIQIQVCHCLCLLCHRCQNCKSSPVFLHGCWLLTNAGELFGIGITFVCLLWCYAYPNTIELPFCLTYSERYGIRTESHRTKSHRTKSFLECLQYVQSQCRLTSHRF